MAAKTEGTWEASSGSLNYLFGDVLWEGGGTKLTYITPIWSDAAPIRIITTLWDTESTVVGVSVANITRGGFAERVS